MFFSLRWIFVNPWHRCAAEAFLGAEIGLKQNLLIPVSMRAVVLKWLVPEMDETELAGPGVGARHGIGRAGVVDPGLGAVCAAKGVS